jgi:steroid delta-isomerase-like uncharacterized protein
MDTAENKFLARAQLERVWSQGDDRAIDELYADGCIMHDPMLPVPLQGRTALRTLVHAYRRAFPNLSFSIDDQIAEGDRVVTRWTARGTHLRDLLGIPATGRQVQVSGATIARIERGRTAELWTHWDRTTLFKQLGVVREPADGVTLVPA